MDSLHIQKEQLVLQSNNRQTCTDSKNMMDISQQAGSKRKSVSEIKNIYSAILHIFQYEKLNNNTAAHSSLYD